MIYMDVSFFKLKVVFAGVEIPRVEINVKPHVDISGIRVEGLENGLFFSLVLQWIAHLAWSDVQFVCASECNI